MAMKTSIVTYSSDGTKSVWLPTTLDKMQKDEKYLESVVADTPSLLQLNARRRGMYGPYVVFQQLVFTTPLSRQIIPDIVLLSESGDLAVVEVKLSSNPELKDRRVIAQAIDYAASLSALSEKDLAELFSHDEESNWASLISSFFPDDDDPEELANNLYSNIKAGKIHVIIACDKAPPGLYEIAKSVSVQSYLSFSLDIIEIRPFVLESNVAGQIMFVPNVGLSTEIVARTAITITHEEGSPEPGVSITTTGIEEIEDNLASFSRPGGSKVFWYSVNGREGAELPTLFLHCLNSIRKTGSADILLKKEIDPELKISEFKHHRGYPRFKDRTSITPEEFDKVCTMIRSAKPME